MKKKYIPLLCTLLLSLFFLSACAREQNTKAYTSNGIYYATADIKTTASTEYAQDTAIDVVREFQFQIQPPTIYLYTEKINGITYTGTLKLIGFTFENGNTTASYKGTLTAAINHYSS